MDQEELRRALQSKAGIRCSDGALLGQLAAAAGEAGLAPRDAAAKLSAWLINECGPMATGLNASLVERFAGRLQREAAAAAAQQGSNKENHTGGGIRGGGAGTPAGKLAGIGGRDFMNGAGTTTPQGKAAAGQTGGGSPLTPQSAPRTAFKARTNRGQVVSTLNPQVPAAAGQEARMVVVVPQGVHLPPRHLYLLERLEDKVAAINARIAAWKDWTAAALRASATAASSDGSGTAAAAAAAGLQHIDWHPVGAPAQEDCFFAGRIVCEVEGGALNDTAVMLEGDSELSEGARVHLDLSQLPAYRLFPGQVVSLRGINPTGSRILVKQLWTHLPPPSSAAQQQQGAGASSAGAAGAMDVDGVPGLGSSSGLTAVVAAGPFCLTDNATSFEPLVELLAQLKARPPNMLVLLGPFVDAEQPLINNGTLDMTFQQLMQTQVVERLDAWQSSLAVPCQVVLMPSVRDAFHHPTLPQPAINVPNQEQHISSLQNPSSFSAGPLLIAAQTTDVLRHLSGAELAKAAPGAPADRLAALASHVVGQRRLYPLYPALPGTCLDLTGDAALQLQQLPDLLLLPSDLAPFAKLVVAAQATAEGGGYTPKAAATQGAGTGSSSPPEVCIVNPGRLAKGGSGGTYAAVTIAEGDSRLADRCRVDIVRV